MTIKFTMMDGTSEEYKNVYQLIHVGGMIMIPRANYEFDAIPARLIRQIHTFHLDEDVERLLNNEPHQQRSNVN